MGGGSCATIRCRNGAYPLGVTGIVIGVTGVVVLTAIYQPQPIWRGNPRLLSRLLLIRWPSRPHYPLEDQEFHLPQTGFSSQQ